MSFFIFTYLKDGLQWLGRTFDLDFAVSEEKLLLGHVFFAPVGLNKDFLGHNVSSNGLVFRWAQGPTNLLFWASPHKNHYYNFSSIFLKFKHYHYPHFNTPCFN